MVLAFVRGHPLRRRGETEVALNNSTPDASASRRSPRAAITPCADGHDSECESSVQSRAGVAACANIKALLRRTAAVCVTTPQPTESRGGQPAIDAIAFASVAASQRSGSVASERASGSQPA